MFKLVTLLKRPRLLTPESFQSAWLAGRGERLRAEKCIRRYIQSHAFPLAYRNGEPACDGLEEIWFDDEATALAFVGAPAALDGSDDADVFGPGTLTMAVREVVVCNGTPASEAWKSVVVCQRKAGMTRKAFFEHWQGQHALIAGRLPRLRRYEQNPVHESGHWQAEGCDGISLVWFDTLDDLKSVVRTPQYEMALHDETNFLQHGGRLPIVLTREHVLVQ